MMEDFVWHSSVGMEFAVHKSSLCDKLPRTAGIMASFVSSSDSKLLIHKASHALWKISEDGEHVEAVTAADVLSKDEFKSGEEK